MTISQVSPNLNAKAVIMNNQPAKKQNAIGFGNQESKKKYENPVSPGMEFFNASIGPAIITTIVGVGSFIAAKTQGAVKHLPTVNKYAGLAAGTAAVITAAITLPSAMYHKSVNLFAKKRELDVYARQKSAETSLSEQIDEKARDKDIKLDDAIGSFAKFNMSRKGNGLGIMNMNM